MCGIKIGNKLEDFSSNVDERSLKRILYSYEEEMSSKGMTTENFVERVLSMFEGEILKAERGSLLDKRGVDFIIKTPTKMIGVQVKSSDFGVQKFLENGTFGDKIILLWVDTSSSTSRVKFFGWCQKNLPKLECFLKEEIINLLSKRNKFKEAGINEFQLHRGRTVGITVQELNTLTMLGLAQFDKGIYKI